MKFEYFVGKEIGKHGGERFEVKAGWQLRNKFAMIGDECLCIRDTKY